VTHRIVGGENGLTARSTNLLVLAICLGMVSGVLAVKPMWWDPPDEFSASINIPSWVYYSEELPITETITHDDSRGIDWLYGAWVGFRFSCDGSYFDYSSESHSCYIYEGTPCINEWDLYDSGDCYGCEDAHWRAGWQGAGTTSWAQVVWKPKATYVINDVWVNGQCKYKYMGSWTTLKNVDTTIDIWS